MAYTAGQVSDKISELRGRITVFQKLCEQIRNNYLPSDGGTSELKMSRSDGIPVTVPHFRAALEDMQGMIDQLNEELVQWEEMVFGPKTVEADTDEVVDGEPVEDDEEVESDAIRIDDEDEDEDEDEEAPVVPLKKSKEKPRGKTRRASGHQSASK